jgi:hypothetical protein
MQAFSLALLDAYQPLLDPLPGSPAYGWGN